MVIIFTIDHRMIMIFIIVIIILPWWRNSSIAIVGCIVTIAVEAPTITSLGNTINMIMVINMPMNMMMMMMMMMLVITVTIEAHPMISLLISLMMMGAHG